MKKSLSAVLLTATGSIVCLILRLLQNRCGFEPDTGLPIVGSPFSFLLPGALLLLTAAAFLLCRQLPNEKEESCLPFSAHFSSRSTFALMLVIGGIFLWCLSGLAGLLNRGGLYAATSSGLFYPVSAVTYRANTILSVLTVPAALCLFPAAAAARRGENSPVSGTALLLPVIYLILRLTISFREMSINASQQAYYVELLAMILMTLSLMAGCGASDAPAATEAPAKNPTEAATEAPDPIPAADSEDPTGHWLPPVIAMVVLLIAAALIIKRLRRSSRRQKAARIHEEEAAPLPDDDSPLEYI